MLGGVTIVMHFLLARPSQLSGTVLCSVGLQSVVRDHAAQCRAPVCCRGQCCTVSFTSLLSGTMMYSVVHQSVVREHAAQCGAPVRLDNIKFLGTAAKAVDIQYIRN